MEKDTSNSPIPVGLAYFILEKEDILLFRYSSDEQFARVEVEKPYDGPGPPIIEVKFLEKYEGKYLKYEKGDSELIVPLYLYFPPGSSIGGNKLEKLVKNIRLIESPMNRK